MSKFLQSSIFSILLLFIFAAQPTLAQDEFITTWDTTNDGVSADNEITIPIIGGPYDISWELTSGGSAGSAEGVTDEFTIDSDTHGSEPEPGIYTITITGNFDGMQFESSGVNTDARKLLTVELWGDNQWTSMESAFRGASNLTIEATDSPDLSQVTSMNGMFWDASSFDQDIGGWETGNVENMSQMFRGASSFNQNIGGWETGNVTNMSQMFSSARSFDQDIGGWETGNVENMSSMFRGASSFNQDIGGWETGNVSNTSFMFFGATSFNQDIGGWETGNVESMNNMFRSSTSFNQDIGVWETGNVTTMASMFFGATSFNQDISGWETGNVTNMNSMFSGSSSFNQDIDEWETSNVGNMNAMFSNAREFDQNLGAWDLSSVTTEGFQNNGLSGMLNGSGLSTENYENTLSGWASQTPPANIPLGADGLIYCEVDARQTLIDDFNWDITGDIFCPPEIVNRAPAVDAENIELDADVFAEFNQPIFEINLARIIITKASSGAFVSNVVATIDDQTLIIAHDDFEKGVEYRVDIPSGVVENDDGVANANYFWRFKTIAAPPMAQNESPENNSNGIALDATVSVDFDQDSDASDLGQVTIVDDNNVEVADVVATLEDNQLTIAHADFENHTQYTVNIPANTVTNADDESVVNKEFSWSFTSIMVAPVAENESPEDESDRIPLDAPVTVNFDQDVTEGDNFGDIKILDADSDPVSGANVTLDNNTITFDDADFENFTEYTVSIPQGAVQNDDEVENDLYEWSFTTVLAAPLTENETPENGSSGVALDAVVSVDFDHDVSEVDLSDIEIHNEESELVDGLNVTLSENTITITHDDFQNFTEYTVSIPAGAVENDDEVSNETFEWSFTTILPTPLAINESPEDESDRIALDAPVTVDFDQDVSEGDNFGDIEILDADNNLVSSVNATLDNNTLTIDHDDFENFTEYTVSISEGVVSNNDDVNNETFNWSFTTIMSAPMAENLTPEDGATAIALDTEVSVEFNQDVSVGDLSDIEIRDADNNMVSGVSASFDANTITIAHDDFENFTEYTVSIPAGAVSNNEDVINEAFNWSFTSILSEPIAENESPEDGSERIALDASVTIDFNQDVSANDLSGVEIQDADNNLVSGVTASLDANTLTISHDDFENVTEYTVSIPAGAVSNNDDVNNESFSWSFTTILSAPIAETVTPEDGATAVALDAEVSIAFNQDVSAGDLSDVEIRDADNDMVSGVSASFDANTITIAHDDFENFTEYTVSIPEGAVSNNDDVSNDSFNWSFTSIKSAPIAESIMPESGTTAVALDAELYVEFNQDVSAEDFSGIEVLDSEQNPVSGVSTSLEENRLTISHDDFEFVTEYTVNIPEGVVSNNDNVINEAFNWSFTTIMALPVAENLSPDDGSTAVALDAELSVAFNQDVEADDLSGIEIRDDQENIVEITNAELEDNVITLTHEGFENGTFYTVSVPESTVLNNDELGNESFSWSFTTILTAPVVESRTPEEDAERVAVDTDITLSFDQDVEVVDLSGIEILDADENVLENTSAEFEDNVITITHDGLANAAVYTVSIPEAVVSNSDELTNESLDWSFTTIMTAPVAESRTPGEDAERVAVDTEITVSFDQDVEVSDLSDIEILDSEDNALENTSAELEDNVITITHDGLANAAVYTVSIPEAAVVNNDAVNNESLSWSFTTILTAPVITSTTPEDEAERVAIDSEITISFDQDVEVVDLSGIEILDAEENALEDTSAELEDNVITITHEGLENASEYTVSIPEAVVANADELTNESLNLSFTTIMTAPMVDSNTPEDGAEQVAVDAEISVTFDQDLNAARLSGIEILDADENALENVSAEIEDNVLTIVHEGLAYWTEYTVMIPDSAVVNSHEVNNESHNWSFTTIIKKPEIVALESPKADTVNVAITPEFVWNESERAELYQIMISEDAEFTEIVMDTTHADTTFQLNEELDFESDYFWKVRASNEGGTSDWSDSTMFTTIIEKPEIVALQSPESDEADVEITPEFVWGESERADLYQIMISEDAEFTEIVMDSTHADTTFQMSEAFDHDSDYYWKVRASNVGGQSAWSDTTMFTTIIDKPEAIVLVAPESNAVDVTLMPEFTWEEEVRTESYEFQLALDEDFEEIIVDSTDITEFALAISEELETATTYFWQVRGVNISGEGDWSETGEFTTIISTSLEGDDLPTEITLRNNYPNPFNPTTTIIFGLPVAEHVHIEVFNVLGQRVATLVNEHKGPGWHKAMFDARRLSSGVYIYRMHAGEFVQTETMMLVK